ncbi:MAG: hypothetical protein CMM01_22705 [Rhodopirellula sp.]|nr:hypothetical protein [Rhodopirellula sp.]
MGNFTAPFWNIRRKLDQSEQNVVQIASRYPSETEPCVPENGFRRSCEPSTSRHCEHLLHPFWLTEVVSISPRGLGENARCENLDCDT